MCAKSTSKYNFDPPLYKDLTKILTQSQPEPKSKMKKKKHSPRQKGKIKAKGMSRLGVQLSSYNHGFSKLQKEHKVSSVASQNHQNNDDRENNKRDKALLEL